MKWEYCVVRAPSVDDAMLNKLGEDRWELVGIPATQNTSMLLLIFKREK